MALTLLGLGTAVPATKISNREARAVAHRVSRLDDSYHAFVHGLYEQVGIDSRYTVLGQDVLRDVLDETNRSDSPFIRALEPGSPGPTTRERLRDYIRSAPDLAEHAARRALADAKLSAQQITHLVTVSCTGFQAPGFDIALMKRLPLSPTVQRTHLGFMGCHGALNGLRVCQAFAGADPAAHILLVAVETCSVHYSYDRTVNRLVTNALFADGAAALVGTGAPTAGVGAWRMESCGSCLLPDSEADMTWNVGDHGFEMTLSKNVPDLLARHLRPWLARWLETHDLGPDRIGSWAVHPGGPKILEAVEAALGLRRDQTAVSREILAEYGNMSSPTVLFVVQRMREQDSPRPCVALGFGPGLVVEATLFR